MGIMSAPTGLQSKYIKKYVLQQSNSNLDVSQSKEDQKLTERIYFVIRSKEVLERENQCSPQKKSEAKKLRSVRLDLSSLKRDVIQKTSGDLKTPKNELSSGDSSEEEAKKKKKPRPVVPNYVTNSDGGPCRKPRQNRQDPLTLSSQNSSAVAKTQPLNIARRNARERNRVKQVNEGFSTLRSRIPDYISEAYIEEKGRKNVKKLSKVETLRMAVDYIRHLENLLDLKSTEDEWLKTENQPWETPSSTEYSSPKYQISGIESPGTSYDQAFEYQDRIFYDYDLDFKEGLPEEKKPQVFSVMSLVGNDPDSPCVDDLKYYETFNKLKKENSENVKAEKEQEDLENLKRDSDSHLLPKSKNVIKKVTKKTVLPPITESFGKGIPVFY